MVRWYDARIAGNRRERYEFRRMAMRRAPVCLAGGKGYCCITSVAGSGLITTSVAGLSWTAMFEFEFVLSASSASTTTGNELGVAITQVKSWWAIMLSTCNIFSAQPIKKGDALTLSVEDSVGNYIVLLKAYEDSLRACLLPFSLTMKMGMCRRFGCTKMGDTRKIQVKTSRTRMRLAPPRLLAARPRDSNALM